MSRHDPYRAWRTAFEVDTPFFSETRAETAARLMRDRMRKAHGGVRRYFDHVQLQSVRISDNYQFSLEGMLQWCTEVVRE